MTPQDLLKSHREALEEARRVLERKASGEAEIAMPAELVQRRATALEARIRMLEAQKDETVRRLDAAIAVEREALDRVRAEEKAWEERRKETEVGKRAQPSRPAAEGKAAKRASKAAPRKKQAPAKKKS